MRVLHVNKFYPPIIGGVEKVVQDLAEGLQDKAELEVLVANTEWVPKKEQVQGVTVYRAPSIGTYFSMPLVPTFPFWLSKFKPDIMHFHFPFPLGEVSYLLLSIFLGTRCKTVVTWHSDIVRQKKFLRIYHPFLKLFLRKVDKIIATSPNMIKHSSYLKDFQEKCEVIPLGINNRTLRQTELRHNVLEFKEQIGEGPILLFVGRLVYYKGAEYLIRAMTKIDATLVIIGEGILKKQLIEMTNVLKISNKVKFIGKVSDEELAVYYQACDVFVLPSVERSEAFGLVQVEAMACGKPVVSTNLTTGVPYVNKDGETGIIVPPRDVEALTKAITMLLDDDDMRHKYGQQAQKRAQEYFTKEKMVENVYNLYCRMLGRYPN